MPRTGTKPHVFDLSDPNTPAYRKAKTSKTKPSKIDPADQLVADMEQQLEQFASDDRRQLLEELVSAGYGTRDAGADGGVHFTDIRATLEHLHTKRLTLEGEMASLLQLQERLTNPHSARDTPGNVNGIEQVKFSLVDIANTPFAKKDSKIDFMANITQMIADLNEKIASLTTARDALVEANGKGAKVGARPKRTMSAEGRKKIAAAQKKRWALVNKAKAAPKKKAVAKKKAAAVEPKA